MIRRYNSTVEVGTDIFDLPDEAVAPKTKLDYALDVVRRGWFVLPCYARTKVPAGRVVPHGVDMASNDENQIREWWAVDSQFNPAIALGPSNLVVWDFDKIAPFANMAPTYTVRTGRAEENGVAGIQMYYAGSCHTHDIKNDKDEIVGEVRSRGAYVMAAGCTHPKTGNPYLTINDVPLAPSSINNVAAPIVVGQLLTTPQQDDRIQIIEASFDASGIDYESPIEHKGGVKWLIRCPWEETHTGGKAFNTSTAVIMWGDGKLIYACQHAHCKNIRQWRQLRDWMEEKIGGRIAFIDPDEMGPEFATEMPEEYRYLLDQNPVTESSSTLVQDDGLFENTNPNYDMSEDEIAAQDEAEFPVYKLHPVAGPDLDESHLYGVLGHVAKKMCQFSEAHLATVYLNLIVSLGNMMGRGPHFTIDGARQYTNEFLANVGDSSTARKGLSFSIVKRLLEVVDPNWFDNRNCGGFSTQQGVLSVIKDDSKYTKYDKKTDTYVEVIQPGIADKRLCIREGELSNVFKIMSDPKQRAGELIRNAWDSTVLSNLVAGKTENGEHNSLICKSPHVSIVGSTTPSLAKSTLPVGADKSGDGNRFIWCFTKRTKHCPQGGPEINWAGELWESKLGMHNLVTYLVAAVAKAKESRVVPIRPTAKRFWNCLYKRLENDPRKGFLGGMTSRAPAHIRRIAMILALMDQDDAVGREHLEAAERIWNYSMESAQYIFLSYDLNQARIIRKAEEGGAAGITTTDVHNLFGRNKPAAWVRAQLADLVKGGFMTRTLERKNVEGGVAHDVDVEVFRFKKW